MKKLMLIVVFGLLVTSVSAELTIEEMHHKMLYPVVRVNGDGSGTVISSKEKRACNEDNTICIKNTDVSGSGKFETHILTNHHVIEKNITYEEVWSNKEGEDVKVEKLSVVYVEIFQYKNLSDSIGTLRIKADIIAYHEGRDLAILKLQSESQVRYVAELIGREEPLYVFSDTMAVGCSLGVDPIPTRGQLTLKNILISGTPYPFYMSQSQIIYGNSGGAMFDMEGHLIGVPSRVPALGWGGGPVPHMGLFIPMSVVYDWLDEEGLQKLYNPDYVDAIEENHDN